MLVRSTLSLFGALGAAAMFLRIRHRRRTVQGRTWPGRDEIARMDAPALNSFLASRGLDVRVVDEPEEAQAV